METITKNRLVTLDYTIMDVHHTIVDEGAEPLMYAHGGYGNIFPKLEEALEGKRVGDPFEVMLSASEAYGEYDESLLVRVPLDELPEEIEVGMEIEGELESDPENIVIYSVIEIDNESAVLDGNHPLAGLDLIFSGEVIEVIEADEETIQELLEHSHEH